MRIYFIYKNNAPPVTSLIKILVFHIFITLKIVLYFEFYLKIVKIILFSISLVLLLKLFKF